MATFLLEPVFIDGVAWWGDLVWGGVWVDSIIKNDFVGYVFVEMAKIGPTRFTKVP